MNQIIIAKKISHNNVEFLDFAIDENEKLLTFETYAEASQFLKKEVGDSEEILSYVITTIEAQKNNPRLQLTLDHKKQVNTDTSVLTEEYKNVTLTGKKDPLEIKFTVFCSEFEVINNDSVLYKNNQLVPVIAFVDPKNPQYAVQIAELTLDKVFIEKV